MPVYVLCKRKLFFIAEAVDDLVFFTFNQSGGEFVHDSKLVRGHFLFYLLRVLFAVFKEPLHSRPVHKRLVNSFQIALYHIILRSEISVSRTVIHNKNADHHSHYIKCQQDNQHLLLQPAFLFHIIIFLCHFFDPYKSFVHCSIFSLYRQYLSARTSLTTPHCVVYNRKSKKDAYQCSIKNDRGAKMNVFSAIKQDIKGVSRITPRRIIAALAAALALCAVIALRPPIGQMSLPPLKLILALLPPFTALSALYIIVQKPKRSVFLFTKYICLACTPFVIMLAGNLFFDPAKAEDYSQHFYSSFFPQWTALWLPGTFAAFFLMRLAETAVDNGSERGSFAARLAYALAVMYTPQRTVSRQKREGKAKWIAIVICVIMIALAVFIATVTLFLHTVYSNMDFEAILFTIRFAAGGLALEDIISGTLLTVLFAAVTTYLCYNLLKCMRRKKIHN